MRPIRFSLRLLAAVLTFATGTLLVAAWLSYPAGDVTHLEDADCFRTEPAVTSVRCTPPDAPLDLCEVIREPERYESKIIRVRAVFAGYHHSHLFGRRCEEPESHALVDFGADDAAYNLMTRIGDLPEVKSTGQVGKVEVVVVGRFEARNPARIKALMEWIGDEDAQRRLHPIDHYYLFTITDVEQVSTYNP